MCRPYYRTMESKIINSVKIFDNDNRQVEKGHCSPRKTTRKATELWEKEVLKSVKKHVSIECKQIQSPKDGNFMWTWGDMFFSEISATLTRYRAKDRVWKRIFLSNLKRQSNQIKQTINFESKQIPKRRNVFSRIQLRLLYFAKKINTLYKVSKNFVHKFLHICRIHKTNMNVKNSVPVEKRSTSHRSSSYYDDNKSHFINTVLRWQRIL